MEVLQTKDKINFCSFLEATKKPRQKRHSGTVGVPFGTVACYAVIGGASVPASRFKDYFPLQTKSKIRPLNGQSSTR